MMKTDHSSVVATTDEAATGSTPEHLGSSGQTLTECSPNPQDDCTAIETRERQEFPCAACGQGEHIWDDDLPPVENYEKFGRLLAGCADLFRHAGHEGGLVGLSASDSTTPVNISTPSALAAIFVDRLRIRVIKNGKSKGGLVASRHLTYMLRSEVFLGCFRPVNLITRSPVLLPGFNVALPGYNHGGPGDCVVYSGPTVATSNSTQAIGEFLDVMAFATAADRANAVAAALTVLLRNHWPGAKPLILATASKSHAGKDTVITFATGNTRSAAISYQTTDWALERCFVGATRQNTEVGVIIVENARLGRGADRIASGFLERFLTDPEPLLFSTGTGGPTRRANDLIVAISTNHGIVSTDLMNRSLPIHLTPTGNVSDRTPAIGNPKLEYLPGHRDEIQAELLGMIGRWKDAGMPLDRDARHPFSAWAQTVGGILRVSGFSDFLGNYNSRRSEEDAVRRGLGILGAARPDAWLRAGEWVDHVIDEGLARDLIPPGSRDSDKARERGIGIVLSNHRDETFDVTTDAESLVLRLDKTRNRQGEREPATRYRFTVVSRTPAGTADG